MIICKQCGHPNAEGTTFCKNTKCGAFLEWVGEQVPTGMVPAVDAGAAGKAKGLVAATATETDLTVDPGGDVTTEVQVANKGRVVDQVAVRVSGEAGRWATVTPELVNLYPDTHDVTRVTFAPPAGARAGTTSFSIEALSREDPTAHAVVDGTLTIRPTHSLSAKLLPRSVEARQSASYQVVLDNGGNTPVRARLRAEDDNQLLTFSLQPDVVHLGPGEQQVATLTATSRRRPQPAAAQLHNFRVLVEPDADAGGPLTVDGTLTQPAATAKVTKGRALGLRLVLTLLGGVLMVLGAQLSWLDDIRGVELTYDTYANSVFDADVDSPPDGVPTLAASVALPALVFAGFAMLGLLGRKARLTKLFAVLSLLVYGAFAVTLSQGGFSIGSGVFVVIGGAVVALVGGLLANVGRS
jgi:hypothetical protein